MMKDGNYTIFCIQHRRVKETPHGKPDAPLKVMDEPWEWGHTGEWAPVDPWLAYGVKQFRKSSNEWHNNFVNTGYHGWTTLKFARAALKRCRDGNIYEERDGYSSLTQRAVYEFRIVKLILSKQSFILEEEKWV